MKKGMMMKARVPLQVYVEQLLSKRLRDAARRQGVPQARLVRRFIEDGLIQGELHPSDPTLRLIAIGHGKTKDLARRHDAYLAEAYAGRRKRPRR
ncbi:MAG: CopG family transcriptional regulator [Armatimonadota bacterium]